MTYRAVFFDAGETLVHAHPSFPELFTEVLKRQGIEIDPALVRERLFVVSELFLKAARGGELWSTSREKSRRFWDSVYRTFLDELGLTYGDGLAESLYRTFTDVSNYRLFPDVVPSLQHLSDRGLTLAVVSNFEEWLERLLETLDITRYFDVRVISGVEGVEKPDPRIFRLALERTGMEAGDSVYVGDSPAFDIEPATEVGMLGVLLDRRGRHPDYQGIRITSLDELPDAIGLAPPTTAAPHG